MGILALIAMGIFLLLQSVHITTDLPYTKFGMTTAVHIIGNQGRKLNTPSTPKMHNQVLLVTKLTDTAAAGSPSRHTESTTFVIIVIVALGQ